MTNKPLTVLKVAMIGPLGGIALASGQAAMIKEINSWKHQGYYIVAKFFPWENWQAAGEWVKDAEIKVVCGYSNGGSTATWLTSYDQYRETFPVDLLIGLDPTLYLGVSPLTANVKKAVCYYNALYIPFTNWLTIGHSWYTLKKGNKVTDLEIKTIYQWHGNVDKDLNRQKEIYSIIKALMNV